MRKKKVVIMGAGLAGLSCAYELVKQRQAVVVVEKNDWVGGLARTFEVDGFRFDGGPHRWFTKNEEIDKWMMDLMGKEMIRVPRLTRIYFDRKFFNYPVRFEDVFRLGIWTAFRGVFDYLWVRVKGKGKKPTVVSMEDAYTDQFGKTLYEIFFRRYSEKLWGRPCSQLSGDWVAQRTRRMSLLTVVGEFLPFLKKKKVVISLVDSFFYPRSGIGEISQRLKKKIEKRGGKIILGTGVVRVNYRDKRIVSLKLKKGDKGWLLKADEFISSIPLTDLVKRMNPFPSEDVIKATNKLTYRSDVFVVLLVKGKHFLPDNWVYVHSPQVPYVRLAETDNFSEKLSPSGKTSFVFEIPCNEGDKVWKEKDEKLVGLIIKSFVSELGVVEKKDIIKGVVFRQPKVYPVYSLGYQRPLKKIKQFVYRFSNLQTIGRYGIFRYNNMDHSILTGIYAARNVMGSQFDVESVNIGQEYLEEKKTK